MCVQRYAKIQKLIWALKRGSECYRGIQCWLYLCPRCPTAHVPSPTIADRGLHKFWTEGNVGAPGRRTDGTGGRRLVPVPVPVRQHGSPYPFQPPVPHPTGQFVALFTAKAFVAKSEHRSSELILVDPCARDAHGSPHDCVSSLRFFWYSFL